MSARVRASICECYESRLAWTVGSSLDNSAGSPSLVAADLSEDGNREGSETITYRRSIVKQSNALVLVEFYCDEISGQISMVMKPRLHHASLRLYPHI